MKVKFHIFLNSVVVGDEWSALLCDCCNCGKDGLDSVYPRAIQELVAEGISLTVTEFQSNSFHPLYQKMCLF